MQTTRAIEKLRDQELQKGVAGEASWHNDYKDSAYIFIGGLNYLLSEGDISVVFSQWGEIVDVHLVRDKKTGKSKGFCFLAYEDQRSTILAVDNFNGINLCGRTIRVDHVKKFRPPKEYTEIKEGIDENNFFDALYKPTGPDGRGWGEFRELDEEEKILMQQQQQMEQNIRNRNEKILDNIEQLKHHEIILDEDERWEKMLMKELENDIIKDKIEETKKKNQESKYDFDRDQVKERLRQIIKKEKQEKKKDHKNKKEKKDKKDKKEKKEKKEKKHNKNKESNLV